MALHIHLSQTLMFTCFALEITVGRQVLKDWHGGETDSSGNLTDEAVLAIMERSELFSRESIENVPSSSSQGPKEANKSMALALDRTLELSTAVTSLEHFRMTRTVGRLGPDMERFNAYPADLPETVVEHLCGRTFRSCVENKVDGDSFLEVNWCDDRPLLLDVADTGSVGWPLKCVLYTGRVGLRGKEVPSIRVEMRTARTQVK